MNKIPLIIMREYLTRVRKRSFIVMTILGPLLMAAMFVVPAYLSTKQEEKRVIHVIDETHWFTDKFEGNPNYSFIYLYTDVETAKNKLKGNPAMAVLYIPEPKLNVPQNAYFYSNKPPSFNLQSYVTQVLNREIEKQNLAGSIQRDILKNNGKLSDTSASALLVEKILKDSRSNIQLNTIRVDETGGEQKSYTEAYMIAGMFSAIMIYMFIFMFGAQVMRGVIEEKTNRIVEVIISSVKPFQLMMGKIIGIALVGLTQFLLWIVITFTIIAAVSAAFPSTFGNQKSKTELIMPQSTGGNQQLDQIRQSQTSNAVMDAIRSINFPILILSFIFYFIGGYLLYGALFGAIGSAVDNDADTQQFMLPITVPLILAIMMLQAVVNNPEGPIAFWFSIIPLTSPIIMMVRIPFGVPYWQLGLSMGLLILGFIFTTWLSAKIYRTGILMYGKKVNYRELWKWLRYKG